MIESFDLVIMADEAVEDFKSSLADLTFNSKPLINMLTMLAEENAQHAEQIVKVIEEHIRQVKKSRFWFLHKRSGYSSVKTELFYFRSGFGTVSLVLSWGRFKFTDAPCLYAIFSHFRYQTFITVDYYFICHNCISNLVTLCYFIGSTNC